MAPISDKSTVPEITVPYWSVAGIAAGVRISTTAMPVMALFGLAFGAVAAQKGFTLTEATLMSVLTFAGISQFVAAEIWTHPMTGATIVTLALVTAAVNLRFVLLTASLRTWLGGLPASRTYPALSFVTEPGWLVALRYRAEGGSDTAVLLGSGVALWLVWITGTVLGHVFGMRVAEPERFALDLVVPIFFTAMLVPLWRGLRRAIPWAAAGATALFVVETMSGWWYIMAGVIAGSVVAGIVDERV